ncbi:energy transducer TonB [Maricaulis sp.]|uniref:energy transducer TonB n=1 Tax=Maricaulis sp. TaxID=1486257 RepID=UPI003A8E9195
MIRSLLALICLSLAGCAALPGGLLPSAPQRAPFRPVDVYPTPPNVDLMIGPEDCRGSTLAAVSAPTPAYPAGPYSHGRQGWVVVRFHVYSDGSVHRARVARAVPDGPFNRAALRTVSDWRFQPLDGVDILQNCVVMFEFRAGEVQIR